MHSRGGAQCRPAVVHAFKLFMLMTICTQKERGAQSRPAVVHRLYVEPERRLNGVNVFAIELFDDCRLARVVEAPACHRPPPSPWSPPLVRESTHAALAPEHEWTRWRPGGQGLNGGRPARTRCRRAFVCVGRMAGHIHHQDAHLALHLADLLQDRQQSHAIDPCSSACAVGRRARTNHAGFVRVRTINGGRTVVSGRAEKRFVDALIGFEHG